MGRAGAGGGRRVSSGRSGTRRTGGGHRVGRTGGGHRAGQSSFTGSSGRPGRMPEPHPKRRGPGMPYFYSRRRYRRYPEYRGMGCGGCLTPILILGVILIGIIAAVGHSIPNRTEKSPSAVSSNNKTPVKSSADNPEGAGARKKLDTGHNYINDCIIDEPGWFDDISKTENQLKNFWEKTGVQPYIILRNYDADLASDDEKEQWAIDYYDDHFDRENIFLFVYFAEEDANNDVGYMAYANGYETTSVMDSEAVEIFWNNIDKYWYADLSTDDVFIRTFNDTADTIMK